MGRYGKQNKTFSINISEVTPFDGKPESFFDSYEVVIMDHVLNSAVPHPDVQERSRNENINLILKTKERGVLEIQLSAVLARRSSYSQITDSSTSQINLNKRLDIRLISVY